MGKLPIMNSDSRLVDDTIVKKEKKNYNNPIKSQFQGTDKKSH